MIPDNTEKSIINARYKRKRLIPITIFSAPRFVIFVAGPVSIKAAADPGLKVRFRDIPTETLSFQSGTSTCKILHVGAASADAASAGRAERDHSDAFKAVFLHKCIQDTRFFTPPDGERQKYSDLQNPYWTLLYLLFPLTS